MAVVRTYYKATVIQCRILKT